MAEYDAATGKLSEIYVHAPGGDRPLIQLDYSEGSYTDTRFLYADRQGSIIALADAAGNLVSNFTYGPYGEPSSWGGTRFAYTGQIELPAARLYHYKARVYDPVQGRFPQTDPIGYKDELNLYGYVGDDPLDRSDPTGLSSCKVCDLFMQAGPAITKTMISISNGFTSSINSSAAEFTNGAVGLGRGQFTVKNVVGVAKFTAMRFR